jgi:hypothetical protein
MGADFAIEDRTHYRRSEIVVFIGNTLYVLELKDVHAKGSKTILAQAAEFALQQIEQSENEYNEVARNKGPHITQTVKVALVADTHKKVPKLAHIVSQTGNGTAVTERFAAKRVNVKAKTKAKTKPRQRLRR